MNTGNKKVYIALVVGAAVVLISVWAIVASINYNAKQNRIDNCLDSISDNSYVAPAICRAMN